MTDSADTSRRLTLSFDNGPFASVTPHVLDVLRDFDVLTTFFVCGTQLERAGGVDLIRRASEEGHQIGNHMFSHDVQLGNVSADVTVCDHELGRTQELIGDCASPEKWFRPSGGGGYLGPALLSSESIDYLQRHHHSVVLWSSVPHDWDDPTGWVHTAMGDIEEIEHPLMVLHDAPTGAMTALPEFLEQVRSADVEIVQDFPLDCVPMRSGEIIGSLDGLVAP